MIELGKTISPNSSLKDWFTGFMKRWSNDLKLGKTEKLEKVRSNACRKDIVGKCLSYFSKQNIGFFDESLSLHIPKKENYSMHIKNLKTL